MWCDARLCVGAACGSCDPAEALGAVGGRHLRGRGPVGTLRFYFADDILLARLRLPARRRGCGIRSRGWLAAIAFASCFIECAEGLIDRVGAFKGYFPHLEEMFGRGAFDPGGHRFEQFLATRPNGEYYPSGDDLQEAWNTLRFRVPQGAQAGPLEVPASQAGVGRGMLKLQKKITETLEEIDFRALDDRIRQLPAGDERQRAWRSVDRLSSQWVSSWPTRKFEYGHLQLEEVLTTYLGAESPIVRPYSGQSIPCGGNGGARVCDPYGSQLANATLPGGFTVPHDVTGGELFQITKEAGLPTELTPRHIAAEHAPSPALPLRHVPEQSARLKPEYA